MANGLDTREFIAGYLVEAEEHVRSANAHLLRVESAIEQGEPFHRLVRELFRALHTLKGLSAMVGVEPIVEIAHEMEAILREADQKAGNLARASVELLLRGVAAIEQRLRAFEKGAPVPAAPAKLVEALRQLQLAPVRAHGAVQARLELPEALLAKLSASELEQLVEGVRRGRRSLRMLFSPSPEKSAAGVTITAVREQLGKLADIVKVLPQAVAKTESTPGGLTFVLLLVTDQDDAALRAAVAADELSPIALVEPSATSLPDTSELDGEAALNEIDSTDALQRGTIRVDVARLDDALERLASLVVTRFRLTRQVAVLREQGVDVRELSAVLHDHGREIRALRGAITRARMVPVAQLLERVPLLVRGLSRSTGKQIKLTVDAGDAELDKSVAEQVFPAIVHLVRNAVDHAIETPDERRRLGKPEAGTIRVRCFEHSDSQLEVSIADDGCGIDRRRVAEKARRPVPESDAELLALIAMPGLSTREVANERSGRGMGMDIVKGVVERLRGELSLDTTSGQGTTFTLRIPLSISILDSFAFRCGSQHFVVPLAMVEEIVEIEAGNVFSGPRPGRKRAETKLLLRRGESIPLFDLAQLFELDSASGLRSALVVRGQGQRFAFTVDRMLGQQEVVIRPLEDPLVKVPGVSGTTDLGDGMPTLVLDLLGLHEFASRTGRGTTV